MDAVTAIAQAGTTVVEQSTSEAVKYGVVGILCVVFAYVIIFLYRENRGDRAKMEKERGEWTKERESFVRESLRCTEQCKTEKEVMRADYERKHREVLEGYSHQISQKDEAMRKREEQIRVESALLIEKLAASAERRDEAMGEMLQQFLNKIVK